MPVKLMVANPLVEETRNQVAVKRGPVVYCLESADLNNNNIFDIALPSSINLKPETIDIDHSEIMSLVGEARLVKQEDWKNQLYREVAKSETPVTVRLIPYFAWGNRGHTNMQVWLPLTR